MKNIAVKGCTLTTSPGEGEATITTEPSVTTRCGGKFAYTGNLDITITGYTSSIVTVTGSGQGSGTLTPSAIKTLIDKKFAVLEGDSVDIVVNGFAIAPVTPVPVSEVVTVKISDAGQLKVRGS